MAKVKKLQVKESNDKIELNLSIGLSYEENEYVKKTVTNIDAKLPTLHSSGYMDISGIGQTHPLK